MKRGERIRSRITRTLLIFLLMVFCAIPGSALEPQKQITQYRHETWSIKDGLPQNSVNVIIQTADGYLWLGTGEGLVRFDGIRFKRFDKKNVKQLSCNRITALCEANTGTLWIGTEKGGITGLKNGEFIDYPLEKGDGSNVKSISVDKKGAPWFTTDSGLIRMQSGQFTRYIPKQGLPSHRLTAVLADSRGTYWLGTQGGGLYHQKDGEFNKYTAQGFAGDTIRILFEDRKGHLWVGTGDRGLNRINQTDGSCTRYTTNEGLLHNTVTAIHDDQKGSLWIGTTGGLCRLNLKNGHVSTFTSKEGLTCDNVTAIFEDREGSMWVGTATGLERFNDETVTRFSTKEGLTGNDVKAIYQDRNKNLWIATTDGLNRIKPQDGSITTYKKEDGLTGNTIYALYEDRAGTLWIGTSTGLNSLNPKNTFTTYTTKNGLTDNDVWALCEDRGGGLWLGTPRGLNRKEPGENTFSTFTTKQGLSNDAITLIHEGPEGYLWIGTNRGLNRLKPGDNAFKTYTTGNGPAGNTITSICGGSEGVLWVGTGSGLNRLKNGELKRISAEDGLYDDNILQVLGDDLGKLWINSDKGIFNVGLKQLNDICDGKRTTLHCIPYNEAGSAGECARTGQPGSIKSNDGHLWFSTKNGVLIIAPNQIGLNRLPPPVKIEEIVVADEIKSTILPTNRKKILLAPGIKRFEIHYTGLSLLEPGRVRFQYKLEGFDKRWQEADTRRVAYYTNIASGDYLFKVMACNNDGIWNTTGATVAIEQQPRFYRTILFYIIYLLAMAAVVFAGYRHQFHHYKAREENLNRMAEERNCELKERNEELETIQKIIKNINSEMGLELLSELLLKSAMELFPQAEKGGMLVYDHSKNTFKVSAQLGYDQTLVDELYLTFEELINRYTVGTEQLEEWIYVLRKFDNISAEQKMKVFPKPRAMLVMALVINGVVEGFLTLSNMVEAHAFDQSDIQKICRFREQVVSALSKARAMEQLESKVEGRTTELLQANKMLSEAKETAEKALESAELANRTKSDFIANMSHEIRTPMNAILGFTEILDSELSDEKHKEFLSAIASSGNTLLALINDILDISRIESGKMELQFEPINVGCVLKDIRNIFVAKVKEKGLTFKLEIDPELPQSLILENSRLRQILFNLVGNAVKFTNQGYIALSARKGDSATKGKVDVVFMVQDTGIGIPADKLESIFETFSQVNGQRSSDYGGTGLGLTITRRLTEMMGGEISCRSYEGKGSTFNITFKNITISGETKKIETVGESELDTEAIHFEKATILEVDDMDLNRWLIAQYLEEQNFEIIEAENGQQAVALAKEHRPDLILMDLKMPVMNGYEATRTIKTDDRLKHIPVVAVTASVLLEELLEIKKAGSNSYLKKPINRKELFRELMRFLPYTTNEDWVDAERDSIKMQLELSPHASGPISIETRQRLPGLLTILQGEILDQWQDVRQTFMLDEIEGFAKVIQALGREYGLLVIGSWGDRLFKEIRSFNMQKVALTMKSFPELVNEIKMLHEESKNE